MATPAERQKRYRQSEKGEETRKRYVSQTVITEQRKERDRARSIYIRACRDTLQLILALTKRTKHGDVSIYESDLNRLWRRADILTKVNMQGLNPRDVKKAVEQIAGDAL